MATLTEAIQSAKQDPNSPKAQKLLQGLKEGAFDEIAANEGLDLSAFKSKFAPPPATQQPQIQANGQIPSVAERKGWIGKTVSAVGNVAIGAAKGVAETAKNTAGAVSGGIQKAGSALGGGLAGLLPGQEGFKAGAQAALQKIEEEGTAVDQVLPDEMLEAKNTAQKIGKGIERVAEFVVPAGAVAKGAKALKGAQVLQKTAGAGKITNAAKAVGRTLVTPAAEAVSAGTVSAAQEGEIGKEQAIAAGLGAALPVVGAIGKGIKGLAGKALPEALTKSAIRLTPTQKAAIADIQGGGKTAEEYLLKNKIVGEPAEIAKKLLEKSKTARQTKLKTLEGLKGEFKNEEAKKIADNLVEELSDVAGLEDTLAKVSTIAKALKGRGATLKQLDELKSLGDEFASPFKLAGTVKEGAKSKGMSKLRGGLRKFIEDEAEKLGVANVGSLNQEIRLTRKIGDAIAKQDIGAGGNAMAKLSDYLVGGSVLGGAGGAMSGDFEGALRGALAGTSFVLLKKSFTPKVRIKLANALSKTFNQGEASRLLKYVMGEGDLVLNKSEKKNLATALVEAGLATAK